ncbi:hypothetical protein OG21DRAFT_1513513 [Imleria badia]|nr:hypothetical protein OG21DRAFT_1513513 [Imleria badia]
MQATDTTPADPRVASLKAIFPDFDDAVILSVLESTNNDHDRALDVLLGMNDPSFVPPNPPPAPAPLPNQFQAAPSTDAQRISQEALDEQLARRLALEEQQASTQTWQPQGVEGQTMYQAYHPRRGRNSWAGQPQGQPQIQGQGGKDTMAEFQEGFNRIAESGKKTFSSIVTKVRAKMQDFDQGQGGWSWSQNPPPNQLPQPAPASYASSYVGQQQGSEQGPNAQPYQYAQPANPQRQASQSQPARASSLSSLPRSVVSRPAAVEPAQSASPQQPSYYDPNTRGYDLYGDDEDIQLHDATTPSAVATVASVTTQGAATPPQAYSPASPPPPSFTSSPPSYISPASSIPNLGLSSSSPPARSLSPTITGTKGTTSGTPGGVDFTKLGLLPKRPISLVRPQSPPASGAGASASAPRVAAAHSESTTDSSTDREEPEFVENPFEDRA